jgi:prefoldin subunit 5
MLLNAAILDSPLSALEHEFAQGAGLAGAAMATLNNEQERCERAKEAINAVSTTARKTLVAVHVELQLPLSAGCVK